MYWISYSLDSNMCLVLYMCWRKKFFRFVLLDLILETYYRILILLNKFCITELPIHDFVIGFIFLHFKPFFWDQVKWLFHCLNEVSFRVLRCKILKVEQGVFLSKVDEVLVFFFYSEKIFSSNCCWKYFFTL